MCIKTLLIIIIIMCFEMDLSFAHLFDVVMIFTRSQFRVSLSLFSHFIYVSKYWHISLQILSTYPGLAFLFQFPVLVPQFSNTIYSPNYSSCFQLSAFPSHSLRHYQVRICTISIGFPRRVFPASLPLSLCPFISSSPFFPAPYLKTLQIELFGLSQHARIRSA